MVIRLCDPLMYQGMLRPSAITCGWVQEHGNARRDDVDLVAEPAGLEREEVHVFADPAEVRGRNTP